VIDFIKKYFILLRRDNMLYLLFLIGFVILVKGADYFIDGSVGLATLMGVSPLFIGLSVAAIGTSAPEAAVSIKAAIIAHSTISFGNILGSNIANIGLVTGLGAFLYTLSGRKSTIKREIPYSLFITLILLVLVRDDWFSGKIPTLSRIDGGILLIFFFLYLLYLYRMAISDRKRSLLNRDLSSIKYSRRELLKAFGLTIGGLVGIVLGAKLVVDNAINIAYRWGVSETMISVTVVALGTSLPEVVTSLTAAKKGRCDIAIGNVVGSNIFNILFVLGITSAIRPIQFQLVAFVDLIIVIVVTVLILIFIFTSRIISRKEGGVLLLAYLAYIVFAIIRR